MGAWGPKLYQDDLAEGIRDIYKDRLKRGKTGTQITEELLVEYERELLDPDDAPIFWFALADTQWELGRLEDVVKEKALFHIRDGHDLKRWKLEDSKGALKREMVIKELKEKLLLPQPAQKKISQYKFYKCKWNEGDVYAYSLESEYAEAKGLYGQYFLFHKIGETTYWPGHIIPIVRVKITKNSELPKTKEEFENLEYVQTSLRRCDDLMIPVNGHSYVEGNQVENFITNEFGFLPVYQLKLINTSQKVIPKNLVYIGNYENICPPKIEFRPDDISLPGFIWKSFEELMIERYCGYNLRQYEIYSKIN